ncbi:MAG: GGDEF domain-containing protein, partial [Patescibacteria group bacterium]|nr:GGDEF domain-containing protein [Patescibacteria group bacterium]
ISSLLYIDLDDMKSVNDIYGHNVGDKLLREITKIMLGNFREADIISRLEGECTIARIGGDEFAVILPETTMENAMITGERLRTGTESQLALSMSKYIKNGKPLTISIGCAGYPDSNCTTPEELRHYADIALYNSKHTPEGEPVKNRITMYKEGMIMPEKKSEITETDPTEPAKI